MKVNKRTLLPMALAAVLFLSGCGGGDETADVFGQADPTLSRLEESGELEPDFTEGEELVAEPAPTQDPQLDSPIFRLSEVRSLDGTENHSSELGAAHQHLAEDINRAYSDGISAPSGADRPNPRTVSNLVVDQSEDQPDDGGRTAYLWMWGQFLDHDLSLVHENELNDFPIEVPLGDPEFDPFATGSQIIPFSRSEFDPSSGTSTENPRSQENAISSFIDASMVYGSDTERGDALRSHQGGKLLTSGDNLPPFNTQGFENAGGTGANLYFCGDVRANENLLLLSMHTLFIREHNRLADELKAQWPELDDEQLYQGARKRVGALIQSITYNEYLPALIGEGALDRYQGYDPNVDPRVGILFATAAYRMGHSQVSPTVQRLGPDFEEVPEGNLNLADAFFNPSELTVTGIEPLLRGATREAAQATDARIIDELRNLLFGPPGAGGLDLAALNLQRGRDHGLPDFNTVRDEVGLPPLEEMADLTEDNSLRAALSQAYADIGTIDPWVGLLSEDSGAQGIVGPTLRLILAQQFERLRDGDRFFYLNDPDLVDERDQISETRLSDIIRRNTEITNLPNQVFFDASSQRVQAPSRRRNLDSRIRRLF